MSSCALFAQAYTGLRTLYLECNAIADIEGLDALVNLRCLYLGKNMIHEITGLDSLKQLETLDLSENDIRHVEGLGHLIKLKFLSLSGAQKLHLAHSCCVSTCLVVQYSAKIWSCSSLLSQHACVCTLLIHCACNKTADCFSGSFAHMTGQQRATALAAADAP